MAMLRRLLFLVVLVVPLVVWVVACHSQDSKAPRVAAAADSSAATADFQPKPSPEGCVLCAETNPLLVVDKDGHATGTIRLRNRGTEPLALRLFVSEFKTAGDGAPDDLDATTTLSVADAMTKAVVADDAPLQPKAAFDVTINAANLWQPGPSAASLRNGTEKVIDLIALRYAVPFNLKVDGPTPERAELTFVRNRATYLTLRNDDPMTYRFRWHVQFDGDAINGVETVAPNKAVRLKLSMPSEQFGLLSSGTLRSDTRVGVLTLEHEPHESLRNYPFPVKRYPIAASLSYWNAPWQGLWNSVSILFLLLLGISASLLVNFILPLQKRRVAIKQSLYDIEGRLAGLDDLIDPIDGRLLSQMRVEKKRLRLELRALWPVFPQSGVEMPRLEERLEHFTRRIAWVSAVGELLQNVHRHSASMPSREVEIFTAHCGEILNLAAKGTTEAKAIEDIDGQIAALAVPSPDAEIPQWLIGDLVQQSEALKQKIQMLTSNPDWEPCSKLLATLEIDFPPGPQADGGAGFHPVRTAFVRHEKAIRKAALLVEYMELVEHAPDDDIRKRRLDQRDRLLEALKPGPDESLSKARDVVDETAQNVFLKDLLAEISAKALYFEVDPRRHLCSAHRHRPAVPTAWSGCRRGAAGHRLPVDHRRRAAAEPGLGGHLLLHRSMAPAEGAGRQAEAD